MAGEQEPIVEAPEVEAAMPPIETPEPESLEPEGGEPEEGVEAPQEPEDEFEEFEWNGKTIKAPKGLKDGLLMHKDYTQKTQAIAEQRKALEAQAKLVQEQAQLRETVLEKRAEQIAVRKQLERYRQVNWQQYAQDDPVAAQQHYMTFQQLENDERKLDGEIRELANRSSAEAQQRSREEFAKRMQETQEFAKTNIKGWTPETDKQVIEFALEQGVEMTDLQAAMNPTIYKILHLARLGSQVLSKPAAQPQRTQPVQPTQTVGTRGNAPVRKSLADMSMDEYVAHRQKQMARG